MTIFFDPPKDGLHYLQIGTIINGDVVKLIAPEDIRYIEWDVNQLGTQDPVAIREILDGIDGDELYVSTADYGTDVRLYTLGEKPIGVIYLKTNHLEPDGSRYMIANLKKHGPHSSY